MATLKEALVEAISTAVDDVLAEYLGLGGGKPAPRARGQTRGPRPTGGIAKWVPDVRARRVPNFVIEATGMKTKQAILKKWPETAVFEKGKPLPKTK